jgi:lysozyme family protein
MAAATAKTKAKTAATKAKAKPKAKPVVCATCHGCASRATAHQKQLANEKDKLSPAQQKDLDAFKAHYTANEAHYQDLANQSGVPAPLIAALHWRESDGGSFDVYLDNGQKLGTPTTIVPKGISYKKGQFDQAAVQALKRQATCQKALGMTKDTTDRSKIAAYAESWNGLGYADHGMASPYVYAGTNQYTSGLYTSDGVLSPTTVDNRPGVMPLYDSVAGP